jgi:dihydropteroate synthase
MHSRGQRETLHTEKPLHKDAVLADTIDGLRRAVEGAVAAGIAIDTIAVDPGFGFGKGRAGDLNLLENLRTFSTLDHPIVVGPSRKSTIRSVTADQADAVRWGTAAAVAIAAYNGAHILRVHDVAEMKQVLRVVDAVKVSG